MRNSLLRALALGAMLATPAHAADSCSMCKIWNTPREPFKIHGDTYYVGTAAIASVLVTSPQGHILIDGALKDSAPQIVGNIEKLGFRIEDVKIILNTHPHHDHAGGLSQLQRLSHAQVKASPASAPILRAGGVGRDDPQFGILLPIAPIANVSTIRDGEEVRLGRNVLRAVFTPGHTRGATSWTWMSCESRRCFQVVYADSVNPVSAPKFRFTDSKDYPGAAEDVAKSAATLSALPCDILLSAHPEFSNFWERLARRAAGDPEALVDTGACRRYAANVQKALDERLADEARK